MQVTKNQATRRQALQLSVAALSWPLSRAAYSRTEQRMVEIWKSPECGCCKDWVAHLEANGFKTRIQDTGNAAMRAQLGIPEKFGSCHTGKIDGYALEGHVPQTLSACCSSDLSPSASQSPTCRWGPPEWMALRMVAAVIRTP